MPSANEILDFSDEEAKASPLVVSPQAGAPYDPRPHEDSARRTLAYLLVGLLWLMVSGLLVLVAGRVISVAEVKEFAVLLGPVVALVSAATGFYYGTKSAQPPGGRD